MATLEDKWDDLQESEQNTCDEYNGLVALMDWPGYDDAQTQRRKDSWHWLSDRLDTLKAEIKSSPDSENKANKRYSRRDYIDSVLNGGNRTIHRTGPNYPAGHAWDVEAVYIEEREYYLAWNSAYDAQKQRKTDNLDWLTERRKRIYREAEGSVETDAGPGWDKKDRKERYDNLCIATHYGSAWDEWQAGTWKPPGPTSGWRDKIADWHNGHVGITEDPAGSNCDHRKDGIRNAQDDCAAGLWLRFQPWCGVWAFKGLKAAGLVASGKDSWMASVASIEDMAKAGKGPYKGWTTDGTKAKKGDQVVLFGRGIHVGTVRETPTDQWLKTWEGNTSSGNTGSQSNGGGSFKRTRNRNAETYGYALLRDPS